MELYKAIESRDLNRVRELLFFEEEEEEEEVRYEYEDKDKDKDKDKSVVDVDVGIRSVKDKGTLSSYEDQKLKKKYKQEENETNKKSRGMRRKVLKPRVIDVNYVNENEKDDEDWITATPLIKACDIGDIEVIKLLLMREDIDINKSKANGVTPFYVSCFDGNMDIIKLFLKDKRLEVNKMSTEKATGFYMSCQEGHY